MATQITKDIKVSVEAYYQGEEIKGTQLQHIFSYKVLIENNSIYDVQLLYRHWYIVDSNLTYREIEGEGVIGQQPIILSGDFFDYHSWCPLTTDIGKMYGRFTMQRCEDEVEFNVEIPSFNLVAIHRLN